MHSQVTPYFHFHHHDHKTDHEFVLSSPDTHHSGNNKLCCKAHTHDHKMVEADWNVISNAQNIKVNISLDLVALLADVKIDKPGYENLYIVPASEYKLKSVLPKHSNKAPPLYI